MKLGVASLAIGLLVLTPLEAPTATVRSNGKGGGLWSAPATWEGGRVPAGDSVVILGRDVVDVDASSSGKPIACEDLTVDSQGALRVLGQNKARLTFNLLKGLKIFGGLLVDCSKAPEGQCEFLWPAAEGRDPELLFNEGCKVRLKGCSTNAAPNVAFRVLAPTNAPPSAAPMKPVPCAFGAKMWIECDSVLLEGFEVQVYGVDGSGLKFNEACAFRNCHFIRTPVTFQSCTRIEFEGNRLRDSPANGLYLYGTSHSRVASNVVERVVNCGIVTYGNSDTEYVGNVVRDCGEGENHVATREIFIVGERFEGNRTGLMMNSSSHITVQRCLFASNSWGDVRAVAGGEEPNRRLFDCVFQNPPTNPGTACFSVEASTGVEVVNSPLQTYGKDGQRGTLVFSAYVDVYVTNEQGEALGRVPIRVLSGDQVVAASRTEAVGPMTGHTPLPSSHRPMVVPWHRYSPAQGLANPGPSLAYQLEVDGSSLGYAKQVVPLVVDASFVRADPNKPTKTVTVKLPKAK